MRGKINLKKGDGKNKRPLNHLPSYEDQSVTTKLYTAISSGLALEPGHRINNQQKSGV